MERPKCDDFVGFKCPSELKHDMRALASLTPGKTEADIWKEAAEFRLSFVRMVRLGYWQLRMVEPTSEVQPGLVVMPKV